MRGWIDIFSTSTPRFSATRPVRVKWAVSADAPGRFVGSPPCDSFGGVITVKAVGGKVHTAGQAILQANATAIGSDGGVITVQAGGSGSGTTSTPDATSNIELDNSFIEADGPSGSNTAGGTVNIKSFNGSITGGTLGHIFAKGGNPANGTITLEECSSSDSYLGTVTAPTINENAASATGTRPCPPTRRHSSPATPPSGRHAKSKPPPPSQG
jgi:hypothetical protein